MMYIIYLFICLSICLSIGYHYWMLLHSRRVDGSSRDDMERFHHQMGISWEWYPLVMSNSLLNMAIEIVSFPIKQW